MTNWFHHDPARGPAGPFSIDELIERYRGRLIQADTLVWHDGLREWQPLERATSDLEILLGPQDSSRPPPLPAYMPAAPSPAAATARPARDPRAKKQGMSGCLIALIVCAALAIPMLGILAAIALPAYQDYTIKAKVMQAIEQSEPVKQAMAAHVDRNAACPSDGDAGFETPTRFATPLIESVELGTADDGACTYSLVLPFVRGGAGAPGTAVIAMWTEDDQYKFEFDCQASTLPENYQPAICRSNP